MSRFLVVLLLIAACVIGLGFYRGWFTVDRGKIEEDKHKAQEKVHGSRLPVRDPALAPLHLPTYPN